MYKKIIPITAIVLFTAGTMPAAGQTDSVKTRCYDGIVEIPCDQLNGMSRSREEQPVEPVKPAEPVEPVDSFTDLGNGIIRDNRVGLMWQKAAAPGSGEADFPDRYNWEQAQAYCTGLSLGGHTDWRLPEAHELLWLVDYSRYNPSIDSTHFPETVPGRYWTSTTHAKNSSAAWYVSFYYGYTRNCTKSSSYYVRAVRSME